MASLYVIYPPSIAPHVARVLAVAAAEHVAYTGAILATLAVLGASAAGSCGPTSATRHGARDSALATSDEDFTEQRSVVSLRKLYVAVALPCLGKIIALFIMIWDQQLVVPQIICVLIVSFQHLALSAALPKRAEWQATLAIVIGLVAKAVIRRLPPEASGQSPLPLPL